MSVYKKLNEAREKFHSLKLVKTGENKFAGYKYFELGDFLIPALEVFREVGLCAYVSFDKEIATMTLVDLASDTKMAITSPMGSAALKGCHEVQNIGAVETYQRRYLWVAALEIVEHDALDATTGKAAPEVKKAPIPSSFKSSATMGVYDLLEPDRKAVVMDTADAIVERIQANDVVGAYELASSLTDSEEKTALWSKLDSKVRSAITKYSNQLKETATA